MGTEIIFAADDLSGASELAARIANALGGKFEPGMLRVVLLDPDEPGPDAPGNLIQVFDLDSRGASKGEVRNLVELLAAKRSSEESRVFVKLDSILRGQVRQHLLELSGLGPVIFCPALPSLNRTVEQGVVRIAGQSLSETDLWQSERACAPTSIQALFQKGETALIGKLDYENSASLSRAIERNSAGTRIFIADCESAEDLELLASAASQIPDLMLAGSAEFGAVVGAKLISSKLVRAQSNLQLLKGLQSGGKKPVAVVVGSRSSMALLQVEFLRSLGSNVFDLRDYAGEPKEMAELFGKTAEAVDCFLVSARSLGGQNGNANLQRTVLKRIQGRGLVLTGGATARMVLSLLGVRFLMPISNLGQGQVVALTDTSLKVAIKPGSFGEFDTLHKLVNHITGPIRPEE